MVASMSLVLFGILALGYVANAWPIESVDIEDVPASREENWQLIPDGNYNLHLVDLNQQQNDLMDLAEPYFDATGQTVFRLFTRRNRNNEQVIQMHNGGQLSNSNFNRNHPTRFIIHGWNNDATSDVNRFIRPAYLDRGEFNVFVVDWGRGAITKNYISARNRVGAVGGAVASFIRFLTSQGVALNSIVVVGHSLGAHVAGFTGKGLNRLSSIVALDPALPLFSIDKPNERVNSNDAAYVESMHTDMGGLGFDQPIGDASFYPNYGSQPGCGIDVTGGCSHNRAFEYFAESLSSNNRFWAMRCQNYQEIRRSRCTSSGPNRRMGGEPLNSGINGLYYLATNSRPPYARG